MYLISLEIQRRALPAPRALFVSGRGAPHYAWLPSTMLCGADSISSQTDEAIVAWARDIGVIAADHRVVHADKFAALVRSDTFLGTLEVGQRSDSLPGYALNPPRVTCCPVFALLSSGDKMWPASVWASSWGEVVSPDSFRALPIDDVPHTSLMSDTITQNRVYAELSVSVARLAAEPL
jgi:surfactin synthase thioesterase subunit